MTRARAIWHAALLSAGLLYVALVLFDSIEAPLLGLAFIMLAGFEVIRSHRIAHAARKNTRRFAGRDLEAGVRLDHAAGAGPGDNMEESVCATPPKYRCQ